MSAARVLVVAATRVEAAHVPDGYDVLITGIGKVPAATALTRRLTELAAGPDGLRDLIVVNIGTAGALHDHHDGLFEPVTVLNHEISAEALRSLGYDPRERLAVGAAPSAGSDGSAGSAGAAGSGGSGGAGGGSGTVLASGDLFVTDPVARERLAAQADLVDMESYALAYVAAEFGVPIRMIKHVSDTADESALSWNEVVDHSARILAARLVEAYPLPPATPYGPPAT